MKSNSWGYWTYLALSKGIEGGFLDASGVVGQTHVLQHHDTAQKQSSGVGKSLASNVGSRTVDSLEDGALVTDVAGRSETKTADETGAHVGQNVTVQVGHDKDLVVVGGGIGDDSQTRVVQQLSVELDIGELLGDLAGGVQEETVGHLHDGGLVHDTDLLLVDRTSILEGETENTLGSLASDELDALDNAVNDNVLNAGVFTLSVLTDQDGVDVVVGSLEASDRAAGTQVREEVESTTKGEVEGNVALSNRCLNQIVSATCSCPSHRMYA